MKLKVICYLRYVTIQHGSDVTFKKKIPLLTFKRDMNFGFKVNCSYGKSLIRAMLSFLTFFIKKLSKTAQYFVPWGQHLKII